MLMRRIFIYGNKFNERVSHKNVHNYDVYRDNMVHYDQAIYCVN